MNATTCPRCLHLERRVRSLERQLADALELLDSDTETDAQIIALLVGKR